MVRKFIPTLTVCAALLACGSGARAQLIVGDGFGDVPGAITNVGGGSGWPADNNHNWFTIGGTSADQVTSGGLSFTAGGSALAMTGNKLTTVGSDTGAFRNLPTASGIYGGNTNQTLWIGFLAANGSGTNQAGYAGLSLINAYTSNGTYSQAENLFIGQINGKGQYGFVNDTPSNSNSAPFLTGVATDTTTHFLVARLDFTASGSTEVSLYVDPTPGVEPTGTPQAQEDYTGSFVFNQVRFQSGPGATAAYNFDELRMGSKYADVAPILVKYTVSGTVSLQGVLAGSMAQPLTFTLTPTVTTGGSVNTQTLTPAADGTFTLPNILPGTYTLGIKGSKWLRTDVSVNTTGGNYTAPSLTLVGGDIDGNNRVDLADISAISAAFRSTPGSANWNPACDITCDGRVDLADYSIASANFRKTGDP